VVSGDYDDLPREALLELIEQAANQLDMERYDSLILKAMDQWIMINEG